MGNAGLIIAAVTLLVCVLAGAGVMGRTAMERRRLVERYEHLKKVFRLREQYEAKMQEERRLKAEEEARVAKKANFLAGPAIEEAEEVHPAASVR
jgi:hypothetical protein